QVGHACCELILEAGVVHRRTERRDEGKHVVAVDQLVTGLHRFWYLVGLILDDDVDLAAEDAAGLIDLVEAHLDGVGGRHAIGRRHTGEVSVHANGDFCLGNTARLRRRRRCAHHERRRQHRQFELHGRFLPDSDTKIRAAPRLDLDSLACACPCRKNLCPPSSPRASSSGACAYAASAYMLSINSLYFWFTNLRFSFIVGVSSSSSADS